MAIRCALLSVLCVTIAGLCVGQELPPNASFEERAEGGRLPARWQARSITLEAHRLVQDARSGEWAAQIEFAEGEGNQVSVTTTPTRSRSRRASEWPSPHG